MSTIVIIGIFVIAFLITIYILFHRKKLDVIQLYTGGLGSGKTLNATERVQNRIYASIKYNKKHKLPVPVVYSNTPMYYKTKRLSFKRYLSIPFTIDMMMMITPMIPNSITFIDEFSGFIDQFSYDPKKIQGVKVIDEHIRFWRHYHGNRSHLILTDQCSSNIVLQVRRRANKAINCVRTRFFFGFLAITDYRNIVISEEIKTFEEVTKDSADTDDHIERFVTWHLPRFIHKWFKIPFRYDDRAYSIRYELAFKDSLGYKIDVNELKQFELLAINPKMIYITGIDRIMSNNGYKSMLHDILVERGVIKDEQNITS